MRGFCVAVFSLISHFTFSQFNDSTHYYVNYSSTGVINKTNQGNSYVLNNYLRFNISKKNYSINTSNSWIYGKNENVVTNNDYSASADFNAFKTESNLYYWGLASFDESVSLKINGRLQTGVGVGYNVVNRPHSIVVLSDGFIYEKGDVFINDELGNDRYETVRNSLRLKFRFVVNESLVIDGSDFYQPSLSNSHDYVVKSNTNVSLKIKKWLSLTTSMVYNKFSRTASENLLINYGLTIERYF